MHRAILAGATPEQVADASGIGVRDAFERWERWADVQRHSMILGRPGVTQDEQETVHARFVEAGRGPLAARRGE